MPTLINEIVLQGIFNAPQSGHVTTLAKFWTLPSAQIADLPTIFVPGNVQLQLNGQIRSFEDGAYVYQLNGKLEAMPWRAAWDGGITVGGGPVNQVTLNPYTNKPEGNMATLKFTEGEAPGTSTLTMRMPEGQGAGFYFRYPAASDEDLLRLAEQKNAIVQLKTPDGKLLEGFFAKNSGGVLPKSFGPFAFGSSYDKGDFISITRMPGGDASLFTYKNYTPEELAKATYMGSKPGNELSRLQTVDGKPVNPNKFPQLDTTPALANATGNLEGKGSDAPNKAPDANQSGVESKGASAQPKGAGAPPVETPQGKPSAGAHPVDANAPAAPPEGSGTTALGRLAKVAAPIALVAMPAIEGFQYGRETYNNNGSTPAVAESAVIGLGKGTVDTFLPGAWHGYADITGGDRTIVDRVLNAANDATGTATAVGTAAVVAETAGVITIPAAIPTGFATVVAGISNLGINAAKGALKVTGLAGKDQDGGYIYDGVKAAAGEFNYLMGWDKSEPSGHAANSGTEGNIPKIAKTELDTDHMLRESAAAGNQMHSANMDHVDNRNS